MSVNRKSTTERCVRLGDVLYDEHRRLFLLCRCCLRCFNTLDAFERHSKMCGELKHIVNTIDQLRYDENKCEVKKINSQNELYIYNIDAVMSANSKEIDWEAELEDPRWYNDVQHQTPAVPSNAKAKATLTNAKENVNKAPRQCANRPGGAQQQQPQKQLPNCNISNVARRAVLSSQQQRRTGSIENTVIPPRVAAAPAIAPPFHIKKIVQAKPLLSKQPAPTVMTAQGVVGTNKMPDVAAAKDTQQLLNKLRACGVEVKRRRTYPEHEVTAGKAAPADKNQLALDIMRKLQSNGIKCTKVNNVKRVKLELG